MFYEQIQAVIPEKNIVCVSPHYDDLLFFLGGYILELKEKGLLDTKDFTNISVFSRSNYQERDTEGNKDASLKRVQYASGIRFIEDLECLDDLFGRNRYTYIVMGEDESQVRGKVLNEGDGEMEMAFGSYESMDEKDRGILVRAKKKLARILLNEDTALVLPLSMKGHIDHFIAREAGLCAVKELGDRRKAAVYFAQDKPYAGIMTEQEAAINAAFIAENLLEERAFRHHAEEILRLAFTHYPSQVDDIYNIGVRAANREMQKRLGVTCDCDSLYRLSD